MKRWREEETNNIVLQLHLKATLNLFKIKQKFITSLMLYSRLLKTRARASFKIMIILSTADCYLLAACYSISLKRLKSTDNEPKSYSLCRVAACAL